MADTIADLVLLVRAQIQKQDEVIGALNKIGSELGKTAKQSKRAQDEVKKLSGTMTDLSKSVQVALGPLSGIASRITAITSLANRNTVAIAGLIGAIIGFGALMNKAISAGKEYELTLKALDNRVRLLGDDFNMTADELNNFAKYLGRQTLTNANDARKAMLSLLNTTKLSEQEFKLALIAAQGLAETGYGTIINNARTLARVLDQPGQSLESLRRFGVALSKSEQVLVKTLSDTGREFEARRILLEKLRPVMENAGRSSGTLAGALDELNESIDEFFQTSSANTGVLRELTAAVNAVRDQFDKLRTSKSVNALGLAMRLVAVAARFLAENLDILAGALLGLAAGHALKILLTSLPALAIAIAGVTRAVITLTGVWAVLQATVKKGGLAILGLIAGVAIAFGMRAEVFKEAVTSIVDFIDDLFDNLKEKEREADRIDLFPKFEEEIKKASAALEKDLAVALDDLADLPDSFNRAYQQASQNFLRIQEQINNQLPESDRVRFIDVNELNGDLIFANDKLEKFFEEYVIAVNKINHLTLAKRTTDEFQTEMEKSTERTRELQSVYLTLQATLGESSGKTKALVGVTRALASEQMGLSRALVREASALGDTFEDAFERAIFEGEKLRDMLNNLAKDLLRIIVRSAILEPFGAAIGQAFTSLGVSIFGGIGGGAGVIPASTPMIGGLQHGGAFKVGGTGGADSQVIALRATPGENLYAIPPGQQMGGEMRIEIINRGSDKSVESANTSVDLHGTMTKIFIDDVHYGGPMGKKLENTFGLHRGF